MLHPRFTTWLGTLLLFASGCVSVGFHPPQTHRSDGVSLKDPGTPYEKYSAKDVDAAWMNKSNGSFITYLSECSDTSDPSLQSIRNEVVRGIADVQIQRTETTTYQAREALRTAVSGKVDGVASNVDLLIFKRNGCVYVLTLVALPNAYLAERDHFENFIRGFKAP